ncbi:exported hypothetical protein [Syntrophobacter sp. SbD1]|nr:exported hypothetical protein [Syntrophobacter sp. SbD1]
MHSMPKKIAELVFAPRTRTIWLALAGLFLGSALCPFNPPAEDGPQPVNQGKIMNSAAQNRTDLENRQLERPAPAAREMETATFALG